MCPLIAGEWNRPRRGKLRHKRPKPQGSSDSYASPPGPKSSWPSSESSHPQIGVPYRQTSPLQAPYYTMMATQPGTQQPPRPQQPPGATPMMPPDQFNYSFGVIQSAGMQPFQMEPIQNFPNLQPMIPAQTIHPYMTPVMAVILPNYPTVTPGFPSVYPPAPSMLPQAPINMAAIVPGSTHFPPPLFQAQPPPKPQSTLGPLLCSPRASSSVGDEEEAAEPRALFSSSRSSSPLQLNLLQEELPKPNEGQGSTGHNHSESLLDQRVNEVGRVDVNVHLYQGLTSTNRSAIKAVFCRANLHSCWQESHAEGLTVHLFQGDNPSDSGNHDAQSTSSELLDLLLQEDARSGTGSNASGSGSLGSGSGSGSNGTSTSHTGKRQSTHFRVVCGVLKASTFFLLLSSLL